MTIGGTGLGDNSRAMLGTVVNSLIAINISLAGLAAANALTIHPVVYIGLGVAAIVAQQVKDQLGIRGSTSSRIAKEVDADSTNRRDISESVNTPPTTPPTP